MSTEKQPLLEDVNGVGERMLEENRVHDALALFELAARREPHDGQYANNLGITRFQLGDVLGAVEALEVALTGDGDQRLFTLNFVDLCRTRPRLLRRGLAACRDYLAAHGEDAEIEAAANLIAQEIEAADQAFVEAVAKMPEHAKVKVNGASEPKHFVTMGEKLADCIQENLEGLDQARTILDFGVGLGRVLWPLSQRLPSAQFIGFDVDPMMLESLAEVEVVSDTELISTTHALPDGSVDRAYVISVFTHLDHTTDYWLWELNRVLAPGGRALVSYHDETLYSEFSGGSATITAGGILSGAAELKDKVILGGGSEGSTKIGTFYTTVEWERIVSRFFNIVRTAPRGLNGHQSFSILEKGDARVDSLDIHRTYMRDLEDELYRMRRDANLEI